MPRTRRDRVIADKGYSSRSNRSMLVRRGITVTIPERDDQVGHRRRRGSHRGRPYAFDKQVYNGVRGHGILTAGGHRISPVTVTRTHR